MSIWLNLKNRQIRKESCLPNGQERGRTASNLKSVRRREISSVSNFISQLPINNIKKTTAILNLKTKILSLLPSGIPKQGILSKELIKTDIACGVSFANRMLILLGFLLMESRQKEPLSLIKSSGKILVFLKRKKDVGNYLSISQLLCSLELLLPYPFYLEVFSPKRRLF